MVFSSSDEGRDPEFSLCFARVMLSSSVIVSFQKGQSLMHDFLRARCAIFLAFPFQ